MHMEEATLFIKKAVFYAINFRIRWHPNPAHRMNYNLDLKEISNNVADFTVT